MKTFFLKIKFFRKNKMAFLSAVLVKLNVFFPDRLYLRLIFRCKMGYWMSLKNPKTYSEKIQWLKLYNRNPLYTLLVDKYAVKNYVSKIIGEEYIIPSLGVWDNFEQIDFNCLPNQFVLKCTHDSGGLVICKDKNLLEIDRAKEKITQSLKRKYYRTYREWPYKNVPPRIIAEKYMEDENGELNDFKFFCFDGSVKALFIASDRQNENEDTKFDFFDREFKHLPFTNGHPNACVLPKKPKNFEKMIALAEKLSKGIPHVRVDFYEIGEKVYFGEMTFFHWSGLVPFEPSNWDNIFGSWINLPKQKDAK